MRRVGPVFRIGRNPMVRLLLGSKISDIARGAISGSYSNGPATALDHFGMKFMLHGQRANMRREPSIFRVGSSWFHRDVARGTVKTDAML
jgi:hypothetical protein